jgi:hypothetical protein
MTLRVCLVFFLRGIVAKLFLHLFALLKALVLRDNSVPDLEILTALELASPEYLNEFTPNKFPGSHEN